MTIKYEYEVHGYGAEFVSGDTKEQIEQTWQEIITDNHDSFGWQYLLNNMAMGNGAIEFSTVDSVVVDEEE